jgi:hypothetical protein
LTASSFTKLNVMAHCDKNVSNQKLLCFSARKCVRNAAMMLRFVKPTSRKLHFAIHSFSFFRRRVSTFSAP